MASKPIMFNQEMVKAILDGRKTMTRRVIKYDFETVYNAAWNKADYEDDDYDPVIKK